MTIVTMTAGVPALFPPDRVFGRYTAGAATCVFATQDELANPGADVTELVGNPLTVLSSTYKHVPRSFFGIHSGGVTTSAEGFGLDPMNDIGFGTVRGHDHREITWQAMNPAEGVFDFTNLRTWARTYKQQGRKLLYNIYQTPTWASSNPTGLGPYSSQGWNYAPANWAHLTQFVSALVTECKNIGAPLDYIQLCNEPNYMNSVTTGRRFWGSGPASLAVMSRIVAQAAKAIDPTVKIIAPGCTNWDNANVFGEGNSTSGPPLTEDLAANYFAAMFAANDGAGGGMANWVDMLSFHNYGSLSTVLTRINAVKAAATAAGVGSLPIINSETGFNRTTRTDLQIFIDLARLLIIEATSGILSTCIYIIGNPNSTNTLSLRSTPNTIIYLTKLIEEIVTYGIESAAFISGGRVAVKINGTVRIY
jgi:hypothetical protein